MAEGQVLRQAEQSPHEPDLSSLNRGGRQAWSLVLLLRTAFQQLGKNRLKNLLFFISAPLLICCAS
jgi:hypothetical protein